MKTTILKSVTLLVFFSLFSLGIKAAGLQNYLQDTEITGATDAITKTSAVTEKVLTPSSDIPGEQFTSVLELIVAGIVASALILSILVLFLGRWAGNREKKAIKKIRVEVEQEKEHVTAAASTIKQQEKETTLLANYMRDEIKDLADHKDNIQRYESKIIETSDQVTNKGLQIDQITEEVSGRFDKIQNYWESQLNDTVSTIKELQGNLDQSFNKVDSNIEKMHHQKLLSQELLQDFLDKHNDQGQIIEKNMEVSEEVSKNLDETLKESKQLVGLLKQYQENAEKSLKNFTNELTTFEEQAYEQFDASFQVADLARQELNANVDESRKHIETMRRNEEKSHTINTQTQKNLESLDYSKIVKLSNTIDSAQDMFTDMHSKVEQTKLMLDELKDIETDIRKTADSVGSRIDASSKVEIDDDKKQDKLLDDEHLHKNLDEKMDSQENPEYKMVSGDSTPISFFKNIKKK